jgi:MFS transporter, DHA3 family, macrolide efflux protein
VRSRARLWIFEERRFLFIFIGYSVSIVGTNLSFFAVIVHILNKTGRALDLGLYSVVGLVAALLFGPAIGAIIDRCGNKSTMQAGCLASAVLIALMVLTSQLWQVLAISFLLSISNLAFASAQMALLPELVGDKVLVKANSALSGARGIARVACPAVAAFLISAFGSRLVFLIDSGTYLFCFTCLLLLAQDAEKRRGGALEGDDYSALWEGVRYIVRDPILRLFAVIGSVNRIFFGMLGPLLIIIVTKERALTINKFGIIVTMGAVGSIVGSLLSEPALKIISRTYLLKIALVIEGILNLSMVLAPAFVAIATLYALANVVLMIFANNVHAIVQRSTPATLRGRVFGSIGGVFAPAYLVSVLGGSLLADVFGAWRVAAVSAVLFLIIFSAMAVSWGNHLRAAADVLTRREEAVCA